MLTLTIWEKVKVVKYKNGAIRWQKPNFLFHGNSYVCIFQYLLVKIVTWKVYDLENLGQDHREQHSQ